MKSYLFFFTLVILFLNCQSKQKEKQVAKSSVKEINLPTVSNDMINKMLQEVDYIDYIFHNLPISVSQDEKASINSNILFIKNEPIKSLPLDCKPIGRKFFSIKGEAYLIADVYFGNGCAAYVFLDGEKPIYANAMTEQGVTFYKKIIETGNNK